VLESGVMSVVNVAADARHHSSPTTIADPVHLSVVIPAYNEEEVILQTIAEIEQSLAPLPITYNIIVSDDGCTDGTSAKAAHSGAFVVTSAENSGYGAALKKGIAAGQSEFVAIIDADGTYPADRLPAMLEAAGTADMIVGARDAAMTNVAPIRRPAKLMLNALASYLAQRRIPDLNSGLRVFRRTSLQRFIPLLPEKFSFTTTITLCMVCSNLRVVYLPIDYKPRIGKSKIRYTDFSAFVLLVLRTIMLFNPLRIFMPLGSVLFVLGVGKLCYDILIGNLSESAVFCLLAAIIIWGLGLTADMMARLHLRPQRE
jgi:glycosyltransferase involved in cell wall biosynthesis